MKVFLFDNQSVLNVSDCPVVSTMSTEQRRLTHKGHNQIDMQGNG